MAPQGTTLVAVVVFGVACASEGRQRDIVSARAAFDLDCPKPRLQLTQVTGITYGVRGCGKRATYLLTSECAPGKQCEAILNTPVQSEK